MMEGSKRVQGQQVLSTSFSPSLDCLPSALALTSLLYLRPLTTSTTCTVTTTATGTGTFTSGREPSGATHSQDRYVSLFLFLLFLSVCPQPTPLLQLLLLGDQNRGSLEEAGGGFRGQAAAVNARLPRPRGQAASGGRGASTRACDGTAWPSPRA